MSNDEQKRRFEARIDDPLRQWKLSPMDLPSREQVVRVLARPRHDAQGDRHQVRAWHVLRSDDKKRARLNCISDSSTLIPYEVPREKVKLRSVLHERRL